MENEFNPYTEWLGIPIDQQPPNHYQLLGLGLLETNAKRIELAAEHRMQSVRRFQTGPRGKHTQQILNEISRAKICLLDPTTKSSYDLQFTDQVNLLPGESATLPPAASPMLGPNMNPAAPHPMPSNPLSQIPITVDNPPPEQVDSISIQTGNQEKVSELPSFELAQEDQQRLGAVAPLEQVNFDAGGDAAQMAGGPQALPSPSPHSLSAEETNAFQSPDSDPAEKTSEIAGRRRIPLPILAMICTITVAGLVFGIGQIFLSFGKKTRDEEAQKRAEILEIANRPKVVPKEAVMDGSYVTADDTNNYLLLPKNVFRLKGSVVNKLVAGRPALTLWDKSGDQALWRLNVVVPSTFKVEITYNAPNIAPKSKLLFRVEDRTQTFFIKQTEKNEFVTDVMYVMLRKQGPEELRVEGKDIRGTLSIRNIRIFPRTRKID